MIDTAKTYLRTLCHDLPTRQTGSAGNRAATDFFAATLAGFGFRVATTSFECLDWTEDGATLAAGDDTFAAFPSPYSLGCDVRAPLVVASTPAELAAASLDGQLLLLRGELAQEQLAPKNFPFYSVEAHQQIIAMLEEKRPLAIIAATGRDPQMAGGVYPFPLFEDGDFDIPSVYMTDVDGDRLADHAGQVVALESRARRAPATAVNVIGRQGRDPARRIVVMAHIDAKAGTPGALDNGAGVTTLLLLAELLRDYNGALTVEITAINGEDYYSAPGEQLFLAQNAGRLDEIILGINMDGLGYRTGPTAYSLYECPDSLAAAIRPALAARPGLVEGPPWYQGDHTILIMNGRPALALTSSAVGELMSNVVHTASDTPDLVDPAKLVETAAALRDLILRLEAMPQ